MTTTKKSTTTITIGYSSIQNALAHYGADIEKCNFDTIKNSDGNLGQFLFIRTETAMARLAKNIKTQKNIAESDESTEADKTKALEKIAEYEAELAIIEPLNKALESDGFGENFVHDVAIYAYGADHASTLHLNNIDELKKYAVKIRNMGKDHSVHVKSLAETKKAKNPNIYKDMKATMQGMLNAMLPNRDFHVNGDAVFAMCNILVNLNVSTDVNLGVKAGMKYAKVDSIIRQMCKIATLCMAKRLDALEVKAKKEQVKPATPVKDSKPETEPVKDTENSEPVVETTETKTE